MHVLDDDFMGEYAYGEEEDDDVDDCFAEDQAGTMRFSEKRLYETSRGTLDTTHSNSMTSQSGRKRPVVPGDENARGFCGTGQDKACCTIF
jgi:hypothetical protein